MMMLIADGAGDCPEKQNSQGKRSRGFFEQ
jgi:hypothetical protein